MQTESWWDNPFETSTWKTDNMVGVQQIDFEDARLAVCSARN